MGLLENYWTSYNFGGIGTYSMARRRSHGDRVEGVHSLLRCDGNGEISPLLLRQSFGGQGGRNDKRGKG